MHLLSRTKIYMSFGLLAITPMHAFAQSGDLADLQAKVDSYISASMTSEVDSLLSSYSAMKLGQTYSPDSPVPAQGENSEATWKKISYTNASASQLIGYAGDQCASHTTYDQLVAKGVKVDKAKFDSTSTKFCKLVNAAAELKHRYDKYQSIKTNGVVLVKRSRSKKHDFQGRERTFGGGIDLVYKPDIADTAQNGLSLDQRFDYNSWIKWSDDKPRPLNIIKRIREMKEAGASKCEGINFTIIPGNPVDAKMYLNVVNVTSSTLTIQNCMKVRYNSRTRSHSFPEVSVTAPFGYLYELEQMKDNAKVQLKDKVTSKVASMVGANQQMVDLLKKIK